METGQLTEIVVPDWYARRLLDRFGTLQAAERYYGLKIDAYGREFFTTRRLGHIRDRINVKLAAFEWRR